MAGEHIPAGTPDHYGIRIAIIQRDLDLPSAELARRHAQDAADQANTELMTARMRLAHYSRQEATVDLEKQIKEQEAIIESANERLAPFTKDLSAIASGDAATIELHAEQERAELNTALKQALSPQE